MVPQPGEICLPGGHIEPGEKPEDAAIRECFEELGIPKEEILIEGTIESVKKLSGEKICTIVGHCDAELLKTLKISEEEVEEVFLIPVEWLKTHEIKHYLFTNIVDNCGYLPNILKNYLKRYNYSGETGYIEYEGHGIWGLTARILEQAIKENFI